MFSRLIGLLLIVCCGLTGLSQQNDHFIYLQSDNKQAFYVKLSGSSSPLSSSGSGYLILPKVAQGTLSFAIGFPDSAYPEQHFVCSITGDKDKGYLLKRFPEKGWALYDLQELTLTYAVQNSSADSAGGGAVVPAPAMPAAPAPPTTMPALAASTVSAGGVSGADTAVKTDLTGSGASQRADTVPQAAVTAPQGVVTAPQGVVAAPRTVAGKDAFGDILVAVTHDSTLRDIKGNKKPLKPLAETPVKPRQDSVVALKPKQPKLDSSIALVSRQTTGTGVQLVYTDRQASGSVDTVQVLIPSSTPDTAAVQVPGTTPAPVAVAAPVSGATDSGGAVSTGANPVAPVHTDVSPQATVMVDSGSKAKTTDTSHVFDPSTVRVPAKAKDTSNYVVPVFKQGAAQDNTSAVASGGTGAQPLAAGFGVQPAPSAGGALVNTDCKRIAGDEDYSRLRKKMTSESDVDKMIEIARKGFKKTCFTTEQVRNLSFLFLQEDGRYKFLEEAYPFVSDSVNFKSLQTVFSSAYYINRFKALVQR